MVQATPAVCQIPISPTETCGIQAIGRCATCKRAFCTSHQAHESDGWFSHADMCAPCFAQTPKEVARAQQANHKKETFAACQYFASGAAQTALLTAGVPAVQLFMTERQAKHKLFGRIEYIDQVISLHRGWILGEFQWYYSVDRGEGYGSTTSTTERGNCLTALIDSSSGYYGYYSLSPVEPYSGGFAIGGNNSRGFPEDNWIPLMQAVKRLAGLPTP